MLGIERRVCPLRGSTVILDSSRAQPPLPWPKTTIQAPRPPLQSIYEGEGIRVVANPRPLLRIEAPESAAGLGANEVILHASATLESVLLAARTRALDLAGDPRLQNTLWVWERGHGRLEAAHSQLFTSPEPWPGRAWDWDALPGEIDRAISQGRVIDGVVLPWAPQVPFEAWVLGQDLVALAHLTQAWIERLDRALGVPLTLSWQPLASVGLLSIQPRTRPASGLCLAGGVAHHGVPSEVAVELLLQAERQPEPELP